MRSRLKRPEPTEKQFQAAVLELACGWLAYHTHDSRRSAAGFPDLVLVHRRRGSLLFADLKAERGKPTAPQRAWLDALADTDTPAYLWRPSDWRRHLP